MHVTGMVHVNVNCSDFERSRRFYEMLGFRVVVEAPEEAGPEMARAMGMPRYRIRAALLALKGSTPGTLLDLIEWKEPHDPAPPNRGLNHLGIARIALTTSDLDADVARLRAENVKFVSEPATLGFPPGSESRLVCFEDPDGTILELVETRRLG